MMGKPWSGSVRISSRSTCLLPIPGGRNSCPVSQRLTVTQTRDPELSYAAVLTMASLPITPPDRRLIVLYDLYVLRSFERPELPSAAAGHIDFLHARQKKIFEDSITDATRSLFQ